MKNINVLRNTLNAAVIGALSLVGTAQAAALGGYNADPSTITVSGISSGGYMAVQMHVAYSATFKGAAVFAGGPFYCAQGSMSTALGYCMTATSASSIPVSTLVNTTNSWASAGSIDAVSNLASSKVYMFSGTSDSTVKQGVMDALKQYYATYIPAASINYDNTHAAEHAWITWKSGSGINACGTKASPYLNNCANDPEQTFLTQFYGSLNAKQSGALSGSFIEFDQTEFFDDKNPNSHSVATTGWAYVPANCASKNACRLHVSFHGCQQYYAKISDAYIKGNGLNEWADTNSIIVLYPQTKDSTSGPTNPNGCWDWWGYDDANYSKKAGRQMLAVKRMMDRIVSGYVALPAPTGLAVTGKTDNTVSLSWSAVSGASGYNVYRNGAKANSSLVSGTSYTDSGLASGTSYTYTVKAVTSSGAESPASSSVAATTTGTPPAVPAPTGLTAGAVTSTTVALSWTAASGVAGYNVYKSATAGGPYTKLNSSLISGTSYSAGSLTASTKYYFVAKSQSSAGAESPASNEVSATTAAAGVCTTASNWAHYSAGRATNCGGYACAKGSGQNMGLLNTAVITTLKESPTGYFVIGTCN